MSEHSVYILFGGNLGDVRSNFQTALSHMKKSGFQIMLQSGIYSSAPWGFDSDHDFLNMCVWAKTNLGPLNLLAYLKALEIEAGREPSSAVGYASRCLDLDILFYDDMFFKNEHLEIPHPRLHLRKFTLVPLAEIAPDLMHPVFNKSVTELLNECSDESVVSRV
jgi:2-amino-4-hydroxy-6-hydroxymethyldihydropteridine diphosphokinase